MITNILNTLLISLSTAIGVQNANFNYESKHRNNYVVNQQTDSVTYDQSTDLANTHNAWNTWYNIYNNLTNNGYTGTTKYIFVDQSYIYYSDSHYHRTQYAYGTTNAFENQYLNNNYFKVVFIMNYYTDPNNTNTLRTEEQYIQIHGNTNQDLWYVEGYHKDYDGLVVATKPQTIQINNDADWCDMMGYIDYDSSSSSNPESSSSSTTSQPSGSYEQAHIYIDEEYEQKATYNYTEDSTTIYTKKYFIDNSNSQGFYTNPYLYIANTTYTYLEPSVAYLYSVYQFTNYYSSQITIDIESAMQSVTNGYLYKNLQIYLIDNTDAPINETLTSSLFTRLEDARLNALSTLYTDTIEDNERYENVELQNITFNANQTKTFLFYYGAIPVTNTNQMQEVAPTKFHVEGSANIPVVAYEVIDVPNIMFTILTMPFSFITQAFNLTIFPNTPYQINFSNLFMTIIAVFVLIWLIKHIFGK